MALTKIPGNLIQSGAITAAALDNDAVTTAKILDANITHAKLHTSMDLTGKTVTVATAAGSTNTTAAASTAFVQQELTTLIGGAPGTLDTLNELAAAINDDDDYHTTLTTALATKLPLAGGTLTGTLNAVAANFSSDVRVSGWLTGASATNTLFSGNNQGTIIQTPSNTNNAAGSFYIRDSLGNVHFTLNTNTNVSTFAGTIDSGAITSTGTVTAPSGEMQQYRLLQGTALTGGIFKERTITGTGVSNDLSFFAESISDGGEIHFMTGGSATKRVTIDSSGRVGIGTSSPSSFYAGSNQLVVGNGSGEQGITLYGGASSTSYLLFADGTSGATQYAAQINYHHGTNKLGFCTNEVTTARMVIDSTGNVGIGTTAPYGRLELKGNGNSWTTAPAIRMWDDLNSKGWLVGTANNIAAGDFYIRTLPSISGTPDATEQEFTIKHGTGNVGIGTTSPGGQLHVRTTDTTGDIRLGGGNGANNHRIFISAHPTAAYIDSYGGSAYNSLGIQASVLHLNSGSGTGNVGIGTSSPQATLSVKQTLAQTSADLRVLDLVIPGSWSLSGNSGQTADITWTNSEASGTVMGKFGLRYGGTETGGQSEFVIKDMYHNGYGNSGELLYIGSNGEVKVPGTLYSPGHVIQTVYATNTTLVVPSQNINDYTTFIQINITPKYATSKILITGIAGVEVSGGNYPTVHCRLYRDSTHIKSYLYWGYEGAVTTHRILNEPIHFLDSPTTTSALTYYAKLANSSGSAYTGTYSGKAHAYNPSTIMVQEIAQ